MQSGPSATETPTSLARGTTCPNEALGTGTRRYNSSIIHRGNAAEQRLKGSNPTGLPSGRLVTRTRELNIFSSIFLKTTGGKRDEKLWQKKTVTRKF
jgi:hypothetical protein